MYKGTPWPILLVLLCSAVLAIAAQELSDNKLAVASEDVARQDTIAASETEVEQSEHSRWFRLLDFDRFKRMFKKTYSSWREELNRRRLFLARAWRSFLSMLEFRSGNKSSYKSVNEMSDWTREEKRNLVNKRLSSSLSHGRDDLLAPEANQAELAETTGGQEYDALSLDQLWAESSQRRLKREAISETEPEEDEYLSPLSGAGQGNLPRNSRDDERADEAKRDRAVYEIDYRKCFNEPVHQGDCGSCFLWAPLSVLEWHYCKLYHDYRKFSAQYVLDCLEEGSCDGGHPVHVLEFANAAGLERESNWPYAPTRSSHWCPFRSTKDNKVRSAGYWKLNNLKFDNVHPSKLMLQLQKGAPLVVTLATELSFPEYGGGVDEHKGCVKGQDMHTMVLVGAGSQDGRSFFLMRNSYGKHWGERGYYKITFEGLSRCIWRGRSGVQSIDSKHLEFRHNKNYEGHSAKRLADSLRGSVYGHAN